jgi:hypothetical protein
MMSARSITLAAMAYAVPLALFLAAPGSQAADESFVCIADHVAGFDFDRKSNRWVIGNFRATQKFTVARSKLKGQVWEVRDFGSEIALTTCKDDFNDFGMIYCTGLFEQLHFNRKTMRYLRTHTSGYWNEDSLRKIFPNSREGGDNPGIEIGTCTRL